MLLRLDINSVTLALVETNYLAPPSDDWRHQATTSHAISAPDRYDVVSRRGRDMQPISRDYQETASHAISAPDRYDVVRGCGRGIHQLAGNKTYRELVSINKVR